MTNFSVVIPLYNKEKDVLNTIQSVLKQTHSMFEIIIVDDGSTDSSIEIIKNIKDERIRLFSKKNEGVSIARNYGVEKATTEFITFLDADDYWYPNHLENLHSLIAKFPESQWYASAYEKKRTHRLTTQMNSPIMDNGENWFGEIDDFFNYCFVDSLTNSSSVCLKKEFFNSLDGFNKLYTHGEDTDLWIRAALKSSLIFSNKITIRNNLDSSNRSISIPNNRRNSIDLNKFKEVEKSNPSLKKYLDLNRYSQAINFKKAGGDKRIFSSYISNIDFKNLNKKQRLLLKQNKFTLYLLASFQKLLEKLGIRLSSF